MRRPTRSASKRATKRATKRGTKRSAKRATSASAPAAAPAATTQTAPPASLCLFGDVVQDDGSILADRYVLLQNGRIAAVTDKLPAHIKRPDYKLRKDELIFPTFLDLHTHTSYNMLPLWHSPYWAWDNRFQWRGNQEYKQRIGTTTAAITKALHGRPAYAAYAAYSELMALAGGTTVLQENAHLDVSGYSGESRYIIRNTGSAESLGLSADEMVASVLEFYEPEPYTAPRNPYQDTTHWKVNPVTPRFDAPSFLAQFAQGVIGTRTRGTIVHLAEGRSGYLQTRMGPDAYTRNEFESFKTFLTRHYRSDEDIQKVRDAGLLLVHGCGMNTVGDRGLPTRPRATGRQKGDAPVQWSTVEETIDFLLTYGIGVIWSPVSNLLLYQDTTNVLPLLDAGVPVILGTDWTPSGSKTVWEEAKFAAEFLEKQGWGGDIDRHCFRAISCDAADALGLPLGRVREDNLADLMILRRPAGAKRGDALTVFRRAGDADVRAVFVGGAPLYGDASLLQALGATPHALPDETAPRGEGGHGSIARRKAYALPAEAEITAAQIEHAVDEASHIVGKDRARFLAVDDHDYQARMAELRRWVQRFDRRTSPNRIPPTPPKSKLAPGEADWMYNPSLDPKDEQDPEVVELLGRMAPCRDTRCEVPKRHPFYHAEVLDQAGDSYGFRTPCMPVVPVLTTRKAIFAMGDYPTAKFTARSTNNLPVITDEQEITQANRALDHLLKDADRQPGRHPQYLQTYIEELADLVRAAHARPDVVAAEAAPGHRWGKPPVTPPRRNQFFVPVGDVFAPMQDANYFDGYKVRNVAAGVFFHDQYLGAVGVQYERQVWLTNMIKCFLFHESMAASYQALGWTDVQVQQSYSELLPVAKVCSQWVDQEVVLCDPQLVLTVGKPPCTMLHDVPFGDGALQGRVYNVLLGQLLPARDHTLERAVAKALHLSSTFDPPFPRSPFSIDRRGPWANYNVYHMMHPQAVMMSQTAVTESLLSAITLVLGPKARGMGRADLLAELGKYLARHKLSELLRALPYGARDDFAANAKLLEIHAVTLAGFADVLHELGVVDAGPRGTAVLETQAKELARQFHLADTAEEEHTKLVERQRENRRRIDGYLHPRGR